MTTRRGLVARYHVRPGLADAVEQSLLAMAVAVSREEPECLFYRATRSQENSDVFVLYEEYENEKALLAHRETPHFREFIENGVVPMLVSREREILLPVGDPPYPSG